MKDVFVIAEAGSTHDGIFERALELIEVAAYAKADAIKFQVWTDAEALANQRRVPEYYREIYRRYQLPFDWIPALVEHAKAAGIEFMVSVYTPEDIPRVLPFVKRLKIASFEAESNLVGMALWHATTEKQLIVSTGMMTEKRLQDLVLYRDRYLTSKRLAILHCVSSYPVPTAAQMNLAAIGRYNLDGFSDHSRDVLMGGFAVAAGARLIEAHLRSVDTPTQNPDYITAFVGAEFAEYVRHIRHAEASIGSGRKQLQPCEEAMSAYKVS